MEALAGVAMAFDVLLRHFMEIGQRPISARPEGWSGEYETQHLTVGFVDLVDSTGFAERVTADELAGALSRFDALASDIVHAHGARVVKMIGDAVMIIGADATTTVAAAVALVHALAHEPALPPARAGLASGIVVVRDGDFYGGAVNVAARVAKHAPPGRVIATARTGEELRGGGRFVCDDAGTLPIAGVDEPVALVECHDVEGPGRA